MITFTRTVGINPGKQAKALAWAREVAALAKAIDGLEGHVGMPVGGNPNRIKFTTQYENLAAFEIRSAKFFSHPKYLELAASGPERFVSGSSVDELWRDA